MKKYSSSLVIWEMQIKTTHILSTHKDDLNQKTESVSKDMKKLEHTLVIKCKWLHLLTNSLVAPQNRSWKEGSAVKNTCCSSRGLTRFSF